MLHTVEIRRKPGTLDSGVMTGTNTTVYLDGRRLNGVKSIEYSVEAGKPGVVRLELWLSASHFLEDKVESPTPP